MKPFKSKIITTFVITFSLFIFTQCYPQKIQAEHHSHSSGGGHHSSQGHHPTDYCGIGSLNDCTELFTAGLQTHGGANNDKITFECNAKLLNTPSSVLDTKGISSNSGCAKTCNDSVFCTASGNPVATLDAGSFRTQSGGSNFTVNNNQTKTLGSTGVTNYANITVKNSGTLSFVSQGDCTEYKINKITLKNTATLNLAPGYYWINQLKVNGTGAFINVVGEGTVKIFVNQNVTFGNAVSVNYNPSDPNEHPASKLFVYGYNNVTLNNANTFYGFIYSKKQVQLKSGVLFNGAILGKKIKLRSNAVAYYNPQALNSLDLGYLCTPPIHFELSHANEGIKCFKHDITVTAKRLTQTVTDYTEKVILDTGTGIGTWYLKNGNGTFSDPTANDGLAEYTFSSSDNGVAEFQLLYAGGSPDPEVVDVEVYQHTYEGVRDDDTSGTITFYLYGYVISESPFVSAQDPEAQMYSAVQTAGIADDMHITAYGQDGSTTSASCDVRTEYTGNINLKIWQDYVDPTTGTMTMTVDPGANPVSIGNSEANAVTVPFQFNQGRTQMSTVYYDVGKLKLKVKSDNALNIGSTDNFVVKPYSLRVTAYDNPAAVNASGPVFKKAGQGFGASVEVLAYGGSLTPNFGNEIVPEKLEIFSSELVAPVGGRNGSGDNGYIGNGSNLTKVLPGKFESYALSFDEVGIIKLKAQIYGQDYLGAGNVVSAATGNVGRFIPYVFDVTGNTPIFQTLCPSGQFGYIGQSFLWSEAPVLQITAKSLGNTVTKNYFGDFWKLIPAGITQGVISNSLAPISHAAGEPTVESKEADPNLRGTGTITYVSGDGFLFSKVQSTHFVPFDAEIQFQSNIFDSDNVAYRNNPFLIGDTTSGNGILFTQGNTFYQGRFNIKDNIGLESKVGRLQCMTEYYNGTEYVLNKVDNCTIFSNPAYLVLEKEPSDLATTPTIEALSAGRCVVKLTAPGSGKTGKRMSVIVKPQLQSGFYNIPWLQHDWQYEDTLDGLFNDNPAAKYIFGYRGGSESIIYTEEPL